MTTAAVVCCMQVELWRCFLQGAANRLRHQYVRARTADVTRIDAAKLACCFRAATDRCRQLCHQVRVCVCGRLSASVSPKPHVQSTPSSCACYLWRRGPAVPRRRRDTVCTSGLWMTSRASVACGYRGCPGGNGLTPLQRDIGCVVS